MTTHECFCNQYKLKFNFYTNLADKESGKKPKHANCKSSDIIQILGNVIVFNTRSEGSDLPPTCGPNSGNSCCGR